ncbi:MAG: cytochrome [Rubritepida sp.]|nr:cytochrome [Rubritepida sp.]
MTKLLRFAPILLAACLAAPPASAQSRADLLERGRYLGETVTFCGACHNTFDRGMQPVEGMTLAGGRVFEERGLRAVAANITQDHETGIGSWTDVQIAAAIRDGHRPDGSLIGPPMPVESYRGISDRDLAALVAWLRTVPPVRHAVTERSRYPSALTPLGPPIVSVPEPASDDPVARGRYIAVNLAHCMDCHSAQLSEGRADPNGRGARGLVLEGPWGAVQAANISSHPTEGIGRWTDEQILGAITRGVSADGRRLAAPMGGRSPIWARMEPADLWAIIAYLRSLTPQDR